MELWPHFAASTGEFGGLFWGKEQALVLDIDEASTLSPRLWGEWAELLTSLRQEIGDTAFRSWLGGVAPIEAQGGEVVLAAPSRVACNWIKTHYTDRLAELWGQKNSTIHAIDVRVAAGRTAKNNVGGDLSLIPAEPKAPAPAFGPEDPAWMSALDPRFTFENFIVGKPNELAHAAARRVADADDVLFNPLFLYGGVGLGKTHLMHAIAWAIRKRNPERKVLYLSPRSSCTNSCGRCATRIRSSSRSSSAPSTC